MLSSEVPSSRRAFRFLLIWGGLAAVLFGVAAVLTAMILTVHDMKYPPYSLSVSLWSAAGARSWTNPSEAVIPVADYREFKDGSGRLQIQRLPDAGDLFVGPLPPGSHCTDWAQQAIPETLVDAHEATSGGAVYRYSFKNFRGSSIVCAIVPLTASTSFIDRRLDAWEYDPPNAQRPPGEKPLPMLLDFSAIPNADNMRFVGGKPGLRWETDRILDTEEQRIQLYWVSSTQTSLRDILLVIIGSLIALGAATLLEALRPYVDRIAAKTP
jgi:hypothetical protein